MQFDMGQAWNEGVAKVSANFSLLAILGGVFFFLPGVIMYIAMPELLEMSMMPAGDPDATKLLLENIAPTLIPLVLLVMVTSFIGYCAMIALVGDARRLSVGEAIAVGFKSLLPLVGVLLLFVIAYVIGAVLVGVLFGLIVAGVSLVSQGLAYGLAFVLGLAIFVGVAMLLTRFSLTMPVIAIERVGNPITALRRSWTLTRPVQWRLLGFYVLFFIAYFVIAMVLFMIMGLIAAAAGSPAVLGFLNGLSGAIVAIVFSGLLAAIYRQLAGASPEAVSQTFD